MKATEREAWIDGSLYAVIDDGGRLQMTRCFYAAPVFRELQPYIDNWLDHGTFTDKPIEWQEVVPGVVWVSGEWWIRLDKDAFYNLYHNSKRHMFSNNMETVKQIAAARAAKKGRWSDDSEHTGSNDSDMRHLRKRE